MTDKQVLKYLDLLNRKSNILVNSGVNWKPEYENEMKEINKELSELLPLIEEERKNRTSWTGQKSEDITLKECRAYERKQTRN